MKFHELGSKERDNAIYTVARLTLRRDSISQTVLQIIEGILDQDDTYNFDENGEVVND